MDWTFEAKLGFIIALVVVAAILKIMWDIGASSND